MENTHKKAKQQSTTGRRRVGGILKVQGVMEVTPCARIGDLVAWRRRAAKKTAASPSSGATKDKKIKQQSTGRSRRVGSAEGLQGPTEVTPRVLLFRFGQRQRRVASKIHKH